jgi:hypothetical protein
VVGLQPDQHRRVEGRAVGHHHPGPEAPVRQRQQEAAQGGLVVDLDQAVADYPVPYGVGGQQQGELAQVQLVDRSWVKGVRYRFPRTQALSFDPSTTYRLSGKPGFPSCARAPTPAFRIACQVGVVHFHQRPPQLGGLGHFFSASPAPSRAGRSARRAGLKAVLLLGGGLGAGGEDPLGATEELLLPGIDEGGVDTVLTGQLVDRLVPLRAARATWALNAAVYVLRFAAICPLLRSTLLAYSVVQFSGSTIMAPPVVGGGVRGCRVVRRTAAGRADRDQRTGQGHRGCPCGANGMGLGARRQRQEVDVQAWLFSLGGLLAEPL